MCLPTASTVASSAATAATALTWRRGLPISHWRTLCAKRSVDSVSLRSFSDGLRLMSIHYSLCTCPSHIWFAMLLCSYGTMPDRSQWWVPALVSGWTWVEHWVLLVQKLVKL